MKSMTKRLLAALLAVAALFALAGCSKSNKADAAPKDYTKILHDARPDEDNEYDMIFSPGEDGKFTAQYGYSASYPAEDLNDEIQNMLLPLLDLPEDSELYDSAQEIAQAAGHCKEIIQQLSALSRKNVETVYKRPDAGEAFGRVMKMVRSICPDNVELDIDLDFGGAAFLGNETQLSQVVLNMAVNAVHAIGQKEGHIAITGRALGKEELEERGLTPPSRLWERYLCLDIRDDGCGMSSATLAQIFDPFFTTKKAGQGTGLGLSIVKEIIQAHGENIDVVSTEGVGTEFIFSLPRSTNL